MIALGETALGIGTLGRWLGYLGTLGAVGGGVAARLVRRTLADAVAAPVERSALRLGAGAALLALVALPARLAEQTAAFAEPGDPWLPAAATVLRSGWGSAFRLQVATALLLAVCATWAAIAGRYRPGRSGLVVAAGAAASVALVRTGHAVDFPGGAVLGVAVQASHLLGAALWLGTLGALIAAVSRRGIALATVAPALRGFAPMALTGATLVLGGGVVLTWSGVRSASALMTTDYGRLIMVKVAAVVGILTLGAYHWRRGVPELAAGENRSAGPRGSMLAEVLLAVVVLALTAVLSATAAPALE